MCFNTALKFSCCILCNVLHFNRLNVCSQIPNHSSRPAIRNYFSSAIPHQLCKLCSKKTPWLLRPKLYTKLEIRENTVGDDTSQRLNNSSVHPLNADISYIMRFLQLRTGFQMAQTFKKQTFVIKQGKVSYTLVTTAALTFANRMVPVSRTAYCIKLSSKLFSSYECAYQVHCNLIASTKSYNT
jgi:hypothetical protein